MQLIDSHVHLSFFNSQQLEEFFAKGKRAGINRWVMAGYDSQDWQKQITIAQSHENVRMSFGLHPWRVLEMEDQQIESDLKQLEQLLPQAHACGETGIDGFRGKSDEDIEKQKTVFVRHLEMNRAFSKPLVLHIVKSHGPSLEILKKYSYTGIVHGFSGSWEIAKLYIDLGFKISLGRGIYQKGFRNLKETAQKIAMSDFVLESDAALDDNGQPEDPIEILKQVTDVLAELKRISVEKICASNYENVSSIFR